MAIRRDNENLSATPFPKELRALLDASPVYDTDNVYLSEEGWIYRHYKKADKTRWWDEILFSGEVDTTEPTNAPVSATVSAGVKLGSAGYTPTLETGDGTPGFGYGDTPEAGGGGGIPPASDTTVDSATVSGEDNPVTATQYNYTVAATGDAIPYTYSWTVTGGTIDSGATSATASITWGAAGAGSATCEVGSTNADWTGATQSNTLNVTIGTAPTIGGVNLDIVPGSMTVGVNGTFAASIGGNASVTWEWRKASGPGNATISLPNSATTQIQVDAAGDYVFTAEASSSDPGLTGGSPNSLNTGSITASNPTGPVLDVTLVGDTSTAADGTEDTVDTTSANGTGLQVSYDVASGTASNLVLKTSGSGYEEGDTFTVDGDTGVTGTISLTGAGPAAAGFSTPGTYVVTVGGKDATHPYNGQGSGLGYIIDGVQSPTFNIGVGETITFDVSDSTNYNHPIGFYVDAEKSDTATGSTSGVNTAGQAGATVSYTPNSTGTFYYMCENHGYMGGSIVVS